uniref:Uncharacterized protein n=1 Tax=Oryza brachyantha TaxID=4533 RepID=J3LT63_ORYBR
MGLVEVYTTVYTFSVYNNTMASYLRQLYYIFIWVVSLKFGVNSFVNICSTSAGSDVFCLMSHLILLPWLLLLQTLPLSADA